MGAEVSYGTDSPVTNGGGRCRLRLGDFELEASGGDTAATGEVRVVIRPERVRLEPYGTTGPNRVPGMVERLVYQGPATQLVVRLANGEPLQALIQNRVLSAALASDRPFTPPAFLRLLLRVPVLRDLPSRIVAFGGTGGAALFCPAGGKRIAGTGGAQRTAHGALAASRQDGPVPA